MILSSHIPIFSEIFNLQGFLQDPILSFGYQDVVWHERLLKDLAEKRIRKQDMQIFMKLREEIANEVNSEFFEVDVPWQFMENHFNHILSNYGITDIISLDLFDKRADIRHDMNLPIGDQLVNRFNTVIDVGSLEHVFDTRQCLENLFKMLRIDGHLLLHLPCNGYFEHGFYTFNPESITESLRCNGFNIVYLTYSLEPEGIKMGKPVSWSDCLMWCVAQKKRHMDRFVIPQQKGCQAMYGLEPAK
jgi:hypothetical protein